MQPMCYDFRVAHIPVDGTNDKPDICIIEVGLAVNSLCLHCAN